MRKITLLGLFMTVFFCLTGFQGTQIQYTLMEVCVRTAPFQEAQALETVAAFDEIVTLGEEENGWAKVYCTAGYGFVPSICMGDYEEALQKKIASGNYNIIGTRPVLVDNTEDSNLILIGDSRTDQMYQSVGEAGKEASWIAESGKGIRWLKQVAVPVVDQVQLNGKTIIVQMGVNDIAGAGPEASKAYMEFYRTKGLEWEKRGADVKVMSVNPVFFNETMTEADVEEFNEAVEKSLLEQIEFIDTNTMMKTYGFLSFDGLHYDSGTYRSLYTYLTRISGV